MMKFKVHKGIVAPLLIDNVDTDQIIPSREMKRVGRDGLADGLFAGWREEGDFVLDQPEFSGASIILGGKNWGCGSSREHAVWALVQFGIRAVIAESFGSIFRNNCARNGLLAIQLSAAQISEIKKQTCESPQAQMLTIDLEENQIHAPGGDKFSFETPHADRYMLLNGLDFIDYSLRYESSIDSFESNDRAARPWAYLA